MLAPIALALLVPVLASAAPAAKAGGERPTKTALLPFTAGPGVEEEVARALAEPTAAEIRKLPGRRLITEQEIAALLSYDRKRQLLDCEAESCLAEIGGALGAEALAVGTVSRLGESWLITLKLIDVRSAHTVAQADRRLRKGTIDDVLDALPSMVAEVFVPEEAKAKAEAVAARCNLAYLEFLGNGIFTVNYERILVGAGTGIDFGLRVGLGASAVGMLSFSLGSPHHRLEVGVGASMVFFQRPLAATGTIGYRYLSSGNFLLRAGLTPLIATGDRPLFFIGEWTPEDKAVSDDPLNWVPLVGLSVGWVF